MFFIVRSCPSSSSHFYTEHILGAGTGAHFQNLTSSCWSLSSSQFLPSINLITWNTQLQVLPHLLSFAYISLAITTQTSYIVWISSLKKADMKCISGMNRFSFNTWPRKSEEFSSREAYSNILLPRHMMRSCSQCPSPQHTQSVTQRYQGWVFAWIQWLVITKEKKNSQVNGAKKKHSARTEEVQAHMTAHKLKPQAYMCTDSINYSCSDFQGEFLFRRFGSTGRDRVCNAPCNKIIHLIKPDCQYLHKISHEIVTWRETISFGYCLTAEHFIPYTR